MGQKKRFLNYPVFEAILKMYVDTTTIYFNSLDSHRNFIKSLKSFTELQIQQNWYMFHTLFKMIS